MSSPRPSQQSTARRAQVSRLATFSAAAASDSGRIRGGAWLAAWPGHGTWAEPVRDRVPAALVGGEICRTGVTGVDPGRGATSARGHGMARHLGRGRTGRHAGGVAWLRGRSGSGLRRVESHRAQGAGGAATRRLGARRREPQTNDRPRRLAPRGLVRPGRGRGSARSDDCAATAPACTLCSVGRVRARGYTARAQGGPQRKPATHRG